jgi:hypothetical protein
VKSTGPQLSRERKRAAQGRPRSYRRRETHADEWLPSAGNAAEAAAETSQNSGERAEGRRGRQVKARRCRPGRTQADNKRAHADRVEELADSEKQKRQSERVE